MYGLIGKLRTVAGQRDALAAILLDGTQAMPGCLSYIVATDASDPDALWITEVWNSQADHLASLGFGERFETTPLGGYGLGAQG
jgi:quinol monooxygenase YgiN